MTKMKNAIKLLSLSSVEMSQYSGFQRSSIFVFFAEHFEDFFKTLQSKKIFQFSQIFKLYLIFIFFLFCRDYCSEIETIEYQ